MQKGKTLPVLYRSFHFLFVPYGSNYMNGILRENPRLAPIY